MALLRRLSSSGRFGFRFVCAAWFAGSLEILRRLELMARPPERRALEIVASLCLCGALGAWLLWRTRESGAREILENSAALGFWAGVFALIV
jgi:hypothetical protein